MYISIVLGLFGAAGIGWCLERWVYRPIRRTGASPLILLLASLGLYILLQNVISMVFGDDTKTLRGPEVTSGFSILGAKVTGIQLATICAAIAIYFAKKFIIDRSRVGLSLRAVADNQDLARVSGVNLNRAMGIAFSFGSFLAGVAGLLRALDIGMTPTMGLPMLLLGVVAVVLGGNGKALGVAIASLLLAFCQEVAGWRLGTRWEETAAFMVLLAFLMCRPQGIFGKPLKKSTV